MTQEEKNEVRTLVADIHSGRRWFPDLIEWIEKHCEKETRTIGKNRLRR